MEPDVRIAYCQHCKTDVPMLDTKEEWLRITPLMRPLRFENGKESGRSAIDRLGAALGSPAETGQGVERSV